MRQMLEPAAADVGSGFSLVSPHCVMLGEPLPSLGHGVPVCSFERLDRTSCKLFFSLKSAAGSHGPWLYFLEVSMAQWTSEVFQPHCSTLALNEATSGVYLLWSLFCTAPHSWIPINQFVLQTSSQNCPESYPEKGSFISVSGSKRSELSPVHLGTSSRIFRSPWPARVLQSSQSSCFCPLLAGTGDELAWGPLPGPSWGPLPPLHGKKIGLNWSPSPYLLWIQFSWR